MSSVPPAPSSFAFRVGVTGSRFLAPERERALREAAVGALGRVRQIVEGSADAPSAAQAFEVPRGSRPQPRLYLLSALAEGADRLVAEEALKLGYLLAAALPFAQEEYEKDFSADATSLAAFRELLAKAEGRVVALDGARGAGESESYGAVGRLIVDKSDLMMAIWDDDVPAKGAGGTRDTVRYALASGLPVWWIDGKAEREPAFLAAGMDFSHRYEAARGKAAAQQLRAYIGSRMRLPGGS